MSYHEIECFWNLNEKICLIKLQHRWVPIMTKHKLRVQYWFTSFCGQHVSIMVLVYTFQTWRKRIWGHRHAGVHSAAASAQTTCLRSHFNVHHGSSALWALWLCPHWARLSPPLGSHLCGNNTNRLLHIRIQYIHIVRYAIMLWCSCERKTRKRSNCWIKLLFLFSLCKKYSRSFITLQLKHWCHMDYFNNVLTTFLGLECVRCIAVYAGSESSRIS